MPISPEKVRELAARGEGATLDFKVADYDWSRKNAANAELAKDLMAMANVLRPNSPPAYILVGVKNDGTIVGVPAASHLDDAVLHQKVRNLLNQTPLFSYGPVDVDGMSVGVFEIRGGGRPYFSLVDAAPSLRRHAALYRNGSSTDEASPTMILEWAREDDPDAHRLRSLEIRKLEAEARVHGRLRSNATSAGPDAVEIKLFIENIGRSGFWIETCEWTASWNERFEAEMTKANVALPDGYQAPGGLIQLDAGLVAPGGKLDFKFRWTRAEALAHMNGAKLGVPGFSGNWADYHFVVPCCGELGGAEDLRWTARL